MKALVQPREQSGLCAGQIDARHTNLGKSQLTGPALDLEYELNAIDHQPPIVETLHWASEADTQAFAQSLAACAALRNAFITLHGDLGAGKTTFVRHLLRALGVAGRIKSPTYGVVEPHELADGWPVWHFDFYRFCDPREWEDAGFRDIFATPGLKLAEWPEHAGRLLPHADMDLHLCADADGARTVRLSALTGRGAVLLGRPWNRP